MALNPSSVYCPSHSSSPRIPSPSPAESMHPRYTSCREHAYSRSPSISRPASPASEAPPMFPAMQSINRHSTSTITSFSHLPTEIRLQIYSSLLLPSCADDLLPDYEKTRSSASDSFDYDRKQHGSDRLATSDLTRPTILIRTIEGTPITPTDSRKPVTSEPAMACAADAFARGR